MTTSFTRTHTTYSDEVIAEVAHEANRAIQRQTGEVVNFPWENTSIEMRTSIISGVAGIRDGKTPEESHEAWCDYKAAEGWTYGPVKDFAAKTHPCLVAYADLPPEQRTKDSLFSSIVHALTDEV